MRPAACLALAAALAGPRADAGGAASADSLAASDSTAARVSEDGIVPDWIEPPAEVEPGADFEIEADDSLRGPAVEMGFGASGSGSSLRRSRRVRFQGDGLSGGIREGSGDPLAGARLDGRALGGRMRVGRLAPRWGRGLVLGRAAEPWREKSFDREEAGSGPAPSAQGFGWERGGWLRVETLGARYSRAGLGGMRLGAGPLSLGAVAGRGGARQGSASVGTGVFTAEFARDVAGPWRAEVSLSRSAPGRRWTALARGGRDGFRPLADPRRDSPAQALALVASRDLRGAAAGGGIRAQASALGATWRWASGVAGARGALELGVRFPHHGALALGFEEQHGARRRPRPGAESHGGFRQGLWGEWRAGTPGAVLVLRHESWGAAAWARDAVREVTAARVECEAAGARLAVTHATHRVRRGESLYLPEREADRLVLRALSGAGATTRLELGVAAGGGWVRASAGLASADAKRPRARWTIDWTRRSRLESRPRAP